MFKKPKNRDFEQLPSWFRVWFVLIMLFGVAALTVIVWIAHHFLAKYW